MQRTLTLFTLSLAAIAPAQNTLTIPSTAAATDAPTALPIPGFDRSGRMQIVVDASHLQPLVGTPIFGMRFRRDASSDTTRTAGVANLVVTMAPATRTSDALSEHFDDNWPSDPAQRMTVFVGTAQLPASRSPTGRSVSFDNAEDSVHIRFLTPYAYSGGALCIDIVGQPDANAQAPYWPVDATRLPVSGQVQSIGATCAHAGTTYPPTTVADYALVPGSTAWFTGRAAPQSSGAMLIGIAAPPIDLAALGLGGPGCELAVTPYATLPIAFTTAPNDPGLGRSSVSLQIPGGAAALGFAFRTQFAALTSPIMTTNALDCQVATSASSLGMAAVYRGTFSIIPQGRGTVFSNACPVMRFDLR